MTEQPPSYPPPPPGGYGSAPPPPGGYGYQPPPQATGTNGMAIASLVCSVFGWLLCGLGSIVGLVLGFIALGQINKTGQGGRGMAIAGIVIGAIALVLSIVAGIIWATSGSMSNTNSSAPAVVITVEQPVLAVLTR